MEAMIERILGNRLLRIAGRDAPVLQVVAASQAQLNVVGPIDGNALEDYAQIDPTLTAVHALVEPAAPRPNTGYAGLTAEQRGFFLTWLLDPTEPAAAAYQQLYLAHLEVSLLAGGPLVSQVKNALARLHRAPAWAGHEGLGRATLLANWLTQDRAALASWIASGNAAASLLGIAAGQQALLGGELDEAAANALLIGWQVVDQPPAQSLLALRLRSLAATLKVEPLTYALSQLDEAACQPQPWRANHRAIRLRLPQPNVQKTLEPLLREMVTLHEAPTVTPEPDAPTPNSPVEEPLMEDLGWRLILEFGQSRSDLFHFALTIAQRMPTFTQLLDEQRRIVYRVTFKKSEMRQFWRLWDYLQSWSNIHVYVNGQELEKWKIFPYSQYLR